MTELRKYSVDLHVTITMGAADLSHLAGGVEAHAELLGQSLASVLEVGIDSALAEATVLNDGTPIPMRRSVTATSATYEDQEV